MGKRKASDGLAAPAWYYLVTYFSVLLVCVSPWLVYLSVRHHSIRNRGLSSHRAPLSSHMLLFLDYISRVRCVFLPLV